MEKVKVRVNRNGNGNERTGMKRAGLLLGCWILGWGAAHAEFERVEYNHPGLVVDAGVGLWAWPLPADWDGDGDMDLVVSCPDVPFNGIYFFENPGGDRKRPVFRPPVKLGPALKNVRLSMVDGKPRVLTPGAEWVGFDGIPFEATRKSIEAKLPKFGKTRANQWHYVDYDGDGVQDLVVGIGEWTEYGWDNAFDVDGNWTRGPVARMGLSPAERGDEREAAVRPGGEGAGRRKAGGRLRDALAELRGLRRGWGS